MYNNIFFIVYIFISNLIFKFLYYIFIFLIFLILLILFIYIIFLLIPIKYKLKASYINKKIKINLIINFITFYYNEGNIKLKILWFNINKKRKKNKLFKKGKEKNLSNKENNHILISNIKEKKENTKIKSIKYKNFYKKLINKIKLKIIKIKKVYFDYKYIKYIYNIIKDDLILFIKRNKKIFKIKYHNLYGEVGFKDPYKTGKFLALISILEIIFNININGNFEKEVCNLNFKLKGKFNISLFILNILKFIISKKVFKAIKLILNKNITKEEGKKYV